MNLDLHKFAMRAVVGALVLQPAMFARAALPDITGWQDLRFGMSLDQVRADRPNAQVVDLLCGEETKSWIPAGHACESIWLRDVTAAGLKWDATLYFSKAKKLIEIELSLVDQSRADVDTFESLLASLNARYHSNVEPQYRMGLAQWAGACAVMRSQKERGEALRPIDFLQNKQDWFAEIKREHGSIRLRYYDQAWCEGAPTEVTSLPAGPHLELTYAPRTVTTTEGL